MNKPSHLIYAPRALAMLMLLATLSAAADLPFRQHRYDAFSILPVTEDNIVFYGNSITNMHEWWEAFDNPLILNRGNSGGLSAELVENINSIAVGKPAKLFLLIGTNDLATAGINDPQMIADNIAAIIERTHALSPATKIYVQSIFPSSSRSTELTTQTNQLIAELCARSNAEFIDLWDDLQGIPTKEISLDGLHLCASGYRIWCNKIAPLVGSEPVYNDEYEDLYGSLSGSNGMRVSYFGMLPVTSDDVLFIGDEMVHGGEWHELLHSNHIKSRGIGWGYAGVNVPDITNAVPDILTGNGNKVAPKKIFLYAGSNDIYYSRRKPEAIMADYEVLVSKIKTYAPDTQLYIMGLLPMVWYSSYFNSPYVEPLNELLRDFAQANDIEFIDLYSEFMDGTAPNAEYLMGSDTSAVGSNYVSGLGYARLSEILAPHLAEEGATPTTVEDARSTQAKRR